MRQLLLASLFAGHLLCASGQITPTTVGGNFQDWVTSGQPDLFSHETGGVRVSWDSAKPNSYFYLPLPATVTPAEDFKVTLVFQLDALDLGTTPGKLDTFEIGAGLINLTNALDPEYFRGSGVDPAHGARNTVEFDYFPASTFITATVAPTIASADNQILYSHNYPLPLELGSVYKVELAFTTMDRTLRSTLWKSAGADDFSGTGTELKPIVLGTNYSSFAVDALALINYNDQGQNPPQFSGSLQGTGLFHLAQLTYYSRPSLRIQPTASGVRITFETNSGWRYQLEVRSAKPGWESLGAPREGTGGIMTQEIPLPQNPGGRNSLTTYRVRAEKT